MVCTLWTITPVKSSNGLINIFVDLVLLVFLDVQASIMDLKILDKHKKKLFLNGNDTPLRNHPMVSVRLSVS